MSDLISRQAAIDAILAVTGNSSVRELYEHVQEHELSDMWSGGVVAAIDTIIALPSAQPDVPDTNVGDMVSRAAAIDILDAYQVMVENGEENPYAWARLRMSELSSAQSEVRTQISLEDCISRQAAIELAMQYCPDDDGSCSKADRDIRELLDDLENLPSAQPTLYGYNIEHLARIAIPLREENLPPERVAEALTDVGRIVSMVRAECEEEFRKAVERCMI